MILTLTITNVERLENGISTSLKLDRHGAVIGRSTTVDWSLPDPQHYISSRHVEIVYRGGAYFVEDRSTNGTFMNGGQARLAGPHQVQSGDVIIVGHYQIGCRLDGEGAPAAATAGQGQQPGEWGGWKSQDAAAPMDEHRFGQGSKGPAKAMISGEGPGDFHWAPPSVDPKVDSAWNTPQAPVQDASGWSSAVNEAPRPPTGEDVWGKMADSNVVDWGRAWGDDKPDPLGLGENKGPPPDPLGLGQSGGNPVRLRQDPLGLSPPAPPVQPTPQGGGPAGGWGPPSEAAAANSGGWASQQPAADGAAGGWAPQPQPQPQPQAQPQQPQPQQRPTSQFQPQPEQHQTSQFQPQPQQRASSQFQPQPQLAPGEIGPELAAFLAGAGLGPADLKVGGVQAMTAAGVSMRRLVSGMVVMMEARAKAKAQLGAQGTSLEFDGNNPLKFARAPEKAVAQLMNPPERGFMSSERAVEDAFRDLQAHQMATLTAMKGALSATLTRFSPQAIRDRAEAGGLLSKIMPSAREAALWKTYEHEFEGVAQGSDEAFMDVFAKEFRSAYEKVAADMKRKSN